MKVKEELKELKLKSVNELHKMLASNREKLRDLRFKVSQNQLKNIREMREVKKRISKILTLINQKTKEKAESK
jgi:ribosomal protein L29